MDRRLPCWYRRCRVPFRRPFFPLRFERLESRCLLSTFTVTSVEDGGDIIPGNGTCSIGIFIPIPPQRIETGVCTLRAAIEEAESTSTDDTIRFAIDTGIKTITLSSALPSITQPVTIDGTTQPGVIRPCIITTGHPCIELTPSTAGAAFDGLHISGGNATIRGLVLNRFGGDGIELEGNGGSLISHTFIGTDVTGTVDLGNGGNGIFINDSLNNTIGESLLSAPMVISGNDTNGVRIFGNDSLGNTLIGSYIGTTAAGDAPLGNGEDGVLILQADSNTIGGTEPSTRNTISGNASNGVEISGFGDRNIVQGNFVGTNANGTTALPNGVNGVFILISGDNIIGGTTGTTASGPCTGACNLLSGNSNGFGVLVEGLVSSNGGTFANSNHVLGNYIGTDILGSAAVPNLFGVGFLDGAQLSSLGGTDAGAGNLISGNSTKGVYIRQSGGNSLQGNWIGTKANGMEALPNTTGVFLESNDGLNVLLRFNTIGGTSSAARNIISGNKEIGIDLELGSSQSIVQANYIGTSIDGTVAVPNGNNGIQILSGKNTIGGMIGTTPGGPCTGSCNLISGNGGSGVVTMGVFGSTAPNNVIRGNFIGTDAAGTAAVPNLGNGVLMTNVSMNTIGGTDASARNLISGNTRNGILLNPATTQNLIEGNFIGTNSQGTAGIANGEDGVHIVGAGGTNTIGGTVEGAGNVISGNTGDGVEINSSRDDLVQGNVIGADASGNAMLSNAGRGLFLFASSNEVIGGTAANTQNVIAFNGDDGIFIEPGNVGATGDHISSNSIFSNAGLGIDLDPNGVTENDAGDADPGANNRQNFPVLISATGLPTAVAISGTLNSTADTSFSVEYFSSDACDPSGNGEGKSFLGLIVVKTNNNGDANVSLGVPAVVNVGSGITATATDPNGNTSEFSACVPVQGADVSVSQVDSPDPSPPGGEVTYTLTVRNDGPVTATGVVLIDTLPSDTTFVSADSTQGSCNESTGSVICNLGGVTEDATVQIAIVVIPGAPGTITNSATVTATEIDPNNADNSTTEQTTIDERASWHNFRAPFDADDDGTVAPLDVLKIINELNAPRFSDSLTRKLPTGRPVTDPTAYYFDVSGDGFCTSNDALRSINHLNGSQSEGEGSDGIEPAIESFEIGPSLVTIPVTKRSRSNRDEREPRPGLCSTSHQMPGSSPGKPEMNAAAKFGMNELTDWEGLLDAIACAAWLHQFRRTELAAQPSTI